MPDLYIKRAKEPLILDDIVRALPNSKKAIGLNWTYWNRYIKARKKFFTLYEQVREILLSKDSIPELLWTQYVETRSKFFDYQSEINGLLKSRPIPVKPGQIIKFTSVSKEGKSLDAFS